MAVSDYVPFIKPKPARFVDENGRRVFGMIAEFGTPADVFHAAEKVRDAGYQKWDVHTPFPIHDMESAMGIKRTNLPKMVAGGALTGVAGGYLLQWWITSQAYPLVVQGKPFDAWEPFVMVTFELGVLFSAFAALTLMLAMNGLPRWNHPLFNNDRFLDSSDDRFFVVVEAEDENFDPGRTRSLLESAGGSHIDLVAEDA